ncbi:staphylococcal nuclease domain-containing protein 1-like [Musca autumnalis]|uniref:staphylococcal nuclease domain-containing protein 1-like n=1 Tax=Musca autumnalis TaxID=221902 RepID=UPI003CF18B95
MKLKGVVKQVLSGDTVVIRANKGTPPPEKQITFSYVRAPKLARRPGAGGDETKDEPWAWDSREFLRQKLIGQQVTFSCEEPLNSNREYGFVWLGDESGENVVQTMVKEGLVTVHRDIRLRKPQKQEDLQKLIELEEEAKQAGLGKWSTTAYPNDHVRQIKWTQDNPAQIVELFGGKSVKAIIEYVRDGSTVAAFLLPDFYYVTVMMTGIRCPSDKLDAMGERDLKIKVPFVDEARFFVETRLLQREVEILLESFYNGNFIGTIRHPKGNIAESLLREGLAKCVDWSMAIMKEGADILRAAESIAKKKCLRLWRDYKSNAPKFITKEKYITGVVVEVFNGDAISVMLPNNQIKKVFFSSIRAPRDIHAVGEEIKAPPSPINFRPLYEIPFMFDAREYLRKKLINQKVQCVLDYITPAGDFFPEKYCYTVLISGQNVAVAMVGEGLASVVRYRHDDEQRSSCYDQLCAAEYQAIRKQKGMHGEKDDVTMRVIDLTVDHSRIKTQYLPSWQSALRMEGVVEFVVSGSRLRLYMPKDSCLLNFVLAGILCPSSSFPALYGLPGVEGDPFGDDALAFTRNRILQRDVSVHIETISKSGTSVIGWLWTDNNTNLSVALVEEGLAKVHHFSAEKSEYYRQLKRAEDRAKTAKKNIWASYVEEIVEETSDVEETEKTTPVERNVNLVDIIATKITESLAIKTKSCGSDSNEFDALMTKMNSYFQSNPPISGAYKSERAVQLYDEVDSIQDNRDHVFYLDCDNKEVVPFTRLALSTSGFSNEKQLPRENEDKEETLHVCPENIVSHKTEINIGLKPSSSPVLATRAKSVSPEPERSSNKARKTQPTRRKRSPDPKPSTSKAAHKCLPKNKSNVSDHPSKTHIFFPTALTKILSASGCDKVRLILNTGAAHTVICDKLVERLQLKTTHESGRTFASINLQSFHDQSVKIHICGEVRSQLNITIPEATNDKQLQSIYNHLKDLADPHFFNPLNIEIMVANDQIPKILKAGVIQDSANVPLAQSSVFGWIIYGGCQL